MQVVNYFLDPFSILGSRVPIEAQLGKGAQLNFLSQRRTQKAGGVLQASEDLVFAFRAFNGGNEDAGESKLTVDAHISDVDALQARIGDLEDQQLGENLADTVGDAASAGFRNQFIYPERENKLAPEKLLSRNRLTNVALDDVAGLEVIKFLEINAALKTRFGVLDILFFMLE